MTVPSRADLDALLAEDTPFGDLTTEALGLAGRSGRMRFFARGPMVVAGLAVASGLIETAGARVLGRIADGDRVAAGAELLAAEGDAVALHRAWKQAQTTVEILSGIASAARAIVDAVAATGRIVPVACTRKTWPGGRRLAVAAVRAGGCVSHRLGLSETVLVFAEHRVFLPDVTLAALADRLRAAAPEKRLGIEVATPAEALAAADAGFDLVQTEKFTPAALAETVAAVKAARPGVVIAAAGGIDAGNAAAHVLAGADVIVTSAPYTARPADVRVVMSA